jgi:AbrB family looped-hinge helix DNA binding protein
MTYARLTVKGQVTVPKAIRDKLHLEPGDVLGYEVEGDEMRVRKVQRFDRAWHHALSDTLEEWNSPEDDEAFRDL